MFLFSNNSSNPDSLNWNESNNGVFKEVLVGADHQKKLFQNYFWVNTVK